MKMLFQGGSRLRRAQTFFVVVAGILFSAFGATAETTNDFVEAIIQGRKLALQLLEQRPAENFTQTGVLKIRDANKYNSETPIRYEVLVTVTNWQSVYEALYTNATEKLTITRFDLLRQRLEGDFLGLETHNTGNGLPDGSGRKERYIVGYKDTPLGFPQGYSFQGIRSALTKKELIQERLIPFAQSDFWQCDLGLEFLRWPTQKILKKEIRRTCACTVLESTNPNPTTNGYSRVVSWIDTESLGIVEAYAYDFNGKKLKDFYPKDIKKVNGQWQVQTLVMENVQTGSRSRLEFDLKQ